MESTPEPSSEKTIRQESADDFQDMLGILWFLIGCLNPVVLLVVLVTVFCGKKKLRGHWLVICGSLAGIVAVGFFDATYSYLAPVRDIAELMRGNALKLMHENGAADSVVDLVLSHAGTWFCAQIPLGVPVGLIIAGVIILMRSAQGKGNNV